MKKPIKVVMLPTEDKSPVYIWKGKTLICKDDFSLQVRTENAIPQRIYVTVAHEPLVAHDWVIQMETKEIFQIREVIVKGHQYLDYKGNKHWDNYDPWHCLKIIATNDPKLNNYVPGHCSESNDSPLKNSMRFIPQSFLKEFADNPNDGYEVEYEECEVDFNETLQRLKLNQVNEVNIT